MATEIYFVRHGESLDNVAGITFDKMDINEEGILDNPLSDLGKQQAEAAAQWLFARIHPDAIFSSGLTRANMTAEPISRIYNMPIQTLPEIQEIKIERKSLENLKTENNISRAMYKIPHGKEIRDTIVNTSVIGVFNFHNLIGLPGFESIDSMRQRARYALDYFASLPHKRIIAVSHNFFINATLLEILKTHPLAHGNIRLPLGFLPNCSITSIIAHYPRYRARLHGVKTSSFS